MKKRPLDSIRCASLLIGIILIQACSPLQVKRTPGAPYQAKPEEILAMLMEQDRLVKSMVSTGRLKAEGHGTVADVDVLIIAKREPFKIKIEVSHPWGRPLIHLLVHGKQLQIVSFTEKKYYVGRLGTKLMPGLLPLSLEPDQLWTLLRGFQSLKNMHPVFSEGEKRITITNAQGRKEQVIDFNPDNNLPAMIRFPARNVEISLSNFTHVKGIYYARAVQLHDTQTQNRMPFKFKQMIFNTSIPETVFMMKKPADFERIPL